MELADSVAVIASEASAKWVMRAEVVSPAVTVVDDEIRLALDADPVTDAVALNVSSANSVLAAVVVSTPAIVVFA